MNRFETGKQVLPNLKFLNKQEDAFEIMEENQKETKNSADTKESVMNSAYFIDFNNTDVSEKAIREKHLKDDSNNNVSSTKIKRKMSRMKSMSSQNIKYLVDDNVFCPTNDESLHIDLDSSNTNFKVYQDNIEDQPIKVIGEEQTIEIETTKKAKVSECIISKAEQTYPETTVTQKKATSNEKHDFKVSPDIIEDPPKKAIDEEETTKIETMEEASVSDFIISNTEQTCPETVENQKIETREEGNITGCSFDHVRKKTLEKGTSINLQLLDQSNTLESTCVIIDSKIHEGKCMFNTDEKTNEAEHSIQISEETKSQIEIYSETLENDVEEKNNAVSVPTITFEHPSMDESEAKNTNDYLKSDSQEKLIEDDMDQKKENGSVVLTNSQELESELGSMNETPMIIKETNVANIIQDSNER
jgi:hypothetical protein